MCQKDYIPSLYLIYTFNYRVILTLFLSLGPELIKAPSGMCALQAIIFTEEGDCAVWITDEE